MPPRRTSSPLDEDEHDAQIENSNWTDKQRLFAREYLRHNNKARAARKAGYESKIGDVGYAKIGWAIANLPHVKRYIAIRNAQLLQDADVTAHRVRMELARIAFFNVMQAMNIQDDGSAVVDLSELDADSAAAISEVTTEHYVEGGGGDDPREVKRIKIKAHDKLAALDKLARHLKMIGPDVETHTTVNIAGGIAAARQRAKASKAKAEEVRATREEIDLDAPSS